MRVKKLIAVLMVLAMLAVALPVMAAEGSSIEGDDSEGIVEDDGFEEAIIIEDDVFDVTADYTHVIEYYNDAGTCYWKKGKEASFEGDVTAKEKDTALKVDSGYEISVSGDVSGSECGVEVSGSTVTVGGDVIAEDDNSYGVYAEEGATVNVTGDISGVQAGIHTDASTVTVGGDVTAEGEEGVAVYLADAEGVSAIVVEGVADGTYAVAINAPDPDDETGTELGSLLIVSEIQGKLGVADEKGKITEATAEDEEVLKEIIHYIIAKELNGAILNGSEILAVGGKKYETAQEDDRLTVTGKNIKSVTAGKYATVTKNADGSYTILVMRGGDLDIVVKLKSKEKEVVGFAKDPEAKELANKDSASRATYNTPANPLGEGELFEVKVAVTGNYNTIKNNLNKIVIKLDDAVVDKDLYELRAENGNVVIGFEQAFLDGLTAGSHKVQMSYASATFTFEVVK